MAKYRVLVGQVSANDKNGKSTTYCKGCPAGDVFVTDVDMLKYNGRGGLQPKYALLDRDGGERTRPSEVTNPQQETSEDLSGEPDKDIMAMTPEELLAFADEHQVDLGNLRSKDLSVEKNKKAVAKLIQDHLNNS